jgi:hypothetical protein
MTARCELPWLAVSKNGRGEFHNQETMQGTTALVRLVLSDIKPESFQFEEAFSLDGGKTWKANSIGKQTRITGESDQAH